MARKDLHEANRIAWNEATRAHNSHKHDQAGFLRGGGSTLYPDEIALLGDVRGQSLLHLQCNAGQDTLSIAAHLGATVTGVDISDEAIAFAQQLSADSGIPATFIRSDLFDWFETNTQQFDVAFCSYGTVIWLSDLGAWGRGIARALKPGGHFVIIDFHPVLMLFEGDDMRPTYDVYGGGHVDFGVGIGDYVAMGGENIVPMGYLEGVTDFKNPHPSHEFTWGPSDIITALIDAGLALRTFKEYPYTSGFNPYPIMEALPGGRYRLPESWPRLPHMYGIIVQKPAE